jgi:hypothetical protein
MFNTSDIFNFKYWPQLPPLGDAHTPYNPMNPLFKSTDNDPSINRDGTRAQTQAEQDINQARINARQVFTVGLSGQAAKRLEEDRATFYAQYLERYKEVFAKIEKELREAEANEFAKAKAKAEEKAKEKKSWWSNGSKPQKDNPPESSSRKKTRTELTDLLDDINLPHNASLADIKKEYKKQLMNLHPDKIQQTKKEELTQKENDTARANFNEMKDKFDRIDVLMKSNQKNGGSKYNKSRKTSRRRRCRK